MPIDKNKMEELMKDLDRCKADPVYFYNEYVRKEDQPELTKEQWAAYADTVMSWRNCRFKNHSVFGGKYLLTPPECWDTIIPPGK